MMARKYKAGHDADLEHLDWTVASFAGKTKAEKKKDCSQTGNSTSKVATDDTPSPPFDIGVGTSSVLGNPRVSKSTRKPTNYNCDARLKVQHLLAEEEKYPETTPSYASSSTPNTLSINKYPYDGNALPSSRSSFSNGVLLGPKDLSSISAQKKKIVYIDANGNRWAQVTQEELEEILSKEATREDHKVQAIPATTVRVKNIPAKRANPDTQSLAINDDNSGAPTTSEKYFRPSRLILQPFPYLPGCKSHELGNDKGTKENNLAIPVSRPLSGRLSPLHPGFLTGLTSSTPNYSQYGKIEESNMRNDLQNGPRPTTSALVYPSYQARIYPGMNLPAMVTTEVDMKLSDARLDPAAHINATSNEAINSLHGKKNGVGNKTFQRNNAEIANMHVLEAFEEECAGQLLNSQCLKKLHLEGKGKEAWEMFDAAKTMIAFRRGIVLPIQNNQQ
jgi:hypothetical protein